MFVQTFRKQMVAPSMCAGISACLVLVFVLYSESYPPKRERLCWQGLTEVYTRPLRSARGLQVLSHYCAGGGCCEAKFTVAVCKTQSRRPEDQGGVA